MFETVCSKYQFEFLLLNDFIVNVSENINVSLLR